MDYRLGESSLLFVRGLFSDFKDSGRRWAYTLNNNDPALLAATGGSNTPPGFNTEIRAAHYQIGSLLVGGNQVFTKYYANWGFSVSRARVFNPINGGESIDTFSYQGPPGTPPLPPSQCQYDPALTKTVYRPPMGAGLLHRSVQPQQFPTNKRRGRRPRTGQPTKPPGPGICGQGVSSWITPEPIRDGFQDSQCPQV